ncbi:MAG: hypothetical protein ACK47C_00340 [Paracoccaceae bacterium]
MGDRFEFHFEDAKVVAFFFGKALRARGKRPNGEPIPMSAVSADTRFSVVDDRLLVPLTTTDHDSGKIVQAGQSLAMALHLGPGATLDHRIMAVLHSGDFPRPVIGDVITLVGQEPQLKLVGDK